MEGKAIIEHGKMDRNNYSAVLGELEKLEGGISDMNVESSMQSFRLPEAPKFSFKDVDAATFANVPVDPDPDMRVEMESVFTGYHIEKTNSDGKLEVSVVDVKLKKPQTENGITEWSFGSVRKKVARMTAGDSIFDTSLERIKTTGTLISQTLDVIETIGSFDLIKSRRVMDDMFYAVENYRPQFSLTNIGSNSEGFRFTHSDLDILIIPKGMKVFNTMKSLREYKRRTRKLPYYKHRRFYEDNELLYVMDTKNSESGYTRLYGVSIVNPGPESKELNVESWNIHEYFQTKHFVQICECICSDDLPELGQQCEGKHGLQKYNYIYCLHCESWPQEAEDWPETRQKKKWPSQDVVQKVLETGCHLVPEPSRQSEGDPLEWRISFSTAEKLLIRALTEAQFKVYSLLRIVAEKIVNYRQDFGQILYPYVVTTTMLHLMDEVVPEMWELDMCVCVFFQGIRCLIDWVRDRNIPHYFLPEVNLFPVDIEQHIGRDLLSTLVIMRASGIEFVLESSAAYMLGCRIRQCPEIDRIVVRGYVPFDGEGLDLLRDVGEYKNMHYIFHKCTADAYLQLERGIQLYMSGELSPMEKQYMKYLLQNVHRSRAMQMYREYKEDMHLMNTLQQKERIVEIDKEMLRTSSMDATSGRLCIATYYYLQKKYVETLGMTQQAMEQYDWFCMLVDNDGQRNFFDNETCLEYDRIVAGKGLELGDKIISVYAMKVPLWKTSKVIPPELEFDVILCRHPFGLFFNPFVYAKFMLFNAYFYLGHLQKAMKELRRLESTLEEVLHNQKGYITLNMIASCRIKLGEYYKAFQRYRESYERNQGEDNAVAWHACTALYVYMTTRPNTVVIYTGPPPMCLLDLYTGPPLDLDGRSDFTVAVFEK